MDHTQMQQAVIDNVESGLSFPQEKSNSIAHPDATTLNNNQDHSPLSYDELFPELPIAKLKSDESTGGMNFWERNSDMRIASSVITHIFRIPFEERTKIDDNNQFGESASSRICADITAKTGASIEISTAKDQSLNFLISGKKEEVVQAKYLVIDKFQTQARQAIKIPKEHYRFILGKKGKKLQELEAMSGAKIFVPNSSDPSNEIVVKGLKESIEKAIHEINLISDEQSKQAYETLKIPRIYHPFINPLTNEKLAELVSDNSVRINIPPPSVAIDDITIAGEKEGVLNAKDYILTTYQEVEKNCHTVSVEIKKSQHKHVIGSRRSNITEILQATNVSVEMPPLDSPSESVTLRGPQDKLGMALTMLYDKVSSYLTESISAPAWTIKHLIGKKGAKINEITHDFPKVHVEFAENGIIQLEGPKDEVMKLKENLEQIVNEAVSSTSFVELSINPRYLRFIIGKNGTNIKRIRNDCGVITQIIEKEANTVIQLEGNHDDVSNVRKEIEEIATKLENEREKEIKIEPRIHRFLIGTKGEKIKEIREKYNQVQIIIPDASAAKPDMVKIRGTKEDVEQCYRYLTKLSKELIENNFQVKVPVYRKFYKFIIGKSGANISKIREETNTRIEIPAEGEEVTITGKKECCERAKLMLQKIQNEMANIVDIDVIIPAKFHNSLIGAGGKLIRSVSEDCGGISIKFPSADSKSDKVTIRGPKEDCIKAKEILLEMSNEKQLSSFSAEVRAKPELHRYLIGRNGANIRQIRDRTGARIVFPNENDQVRDVITIIGKKEEVENAKKELEATIKELNDVCEERVYIEQKYHRYFLSRRNDLLRELSDQFGGVRIMFPRIGDGKEDVIIKGVQACVEGAKKRIMEVVEDLRAEVTIEVEIPQKYHRMLMGARGSKVIGMESEFEVVIKFPDRDLGANEHEEGMTNGVNGPKPQDIIIVKGKEERCLKAKEALIASVPVEIEVIVPFKYHRYIIGQKGDVVRKFMNDFDVNIKVPPSQDEKDTIVIKGSPAQAQLTKEAIEKKLEEIQLDEEDRLLKSFSIQLKIDPEFHPKIIGRKGATISKIRDKYGVNIQFPSRESSEPDIIVITGYEKNCNEAKEAIMKVTGDWENMIRKTINIASRIHSRLIGSRGWTIRRIMEEHKVEVRFPRSGEDPDVVTVIGMPDNVDDCIDHLLNLTEEFLQDIADREDTMQYVVSNHSKQNSNDAGQNADKVGFVVSGAPWTQATPNVDSSEDFPSMGSSTAPSSLTPIWGPKRI